MYGLQALSESEIVYKNDRGPISSVWHQQARLYMAQNKKHKLITTKKEPIRTLGFASTQPCHDNISYIN